MTVDEFIEKWIQFKEGGPLWNDIKKDLNDLIEQSIYNYCHEDNKHDDTEDRQQG